MTPGLRLLRACLPEPGRLRQVALWSVVESLPSLVSGYAIAQAVDTLVAGRGWLTTAWLGAMAAAMVIGAVATRALYAVVGPLIEDLRDGLMTESVRGTLAGCATTGRPGSATVTQVVEQVDQVRNLVSATVRSLRSTLVPIGAACVGLFLLDSRLGIATALPLLLALLLQCVLVPWTVALRRAVAKAQETFGADVAGVLADLPALRGLGADGWGSERLDDGAASVAAAELRVLRATSIRQGVIMLGAHVPLVCVLVTAVPMLQDGTLSPGAVIGAATYVLTVLAPAVTSFVGVSGGWVVELMVVLERLARIASRPDPPAPVPWPVPAAPGITIELCDVDFAYRPGSRPVVRALNLRVHRGTHVAVLGASGTGKSTLARLIAGVQTPTRGMIRVGGRLCYVPQESYVFAGSLRENLLHLTDLKRVEPGAIDDAILAFGLGEVVDRLGGVDGAVRARHASMSASDLQRIVLARAWLSAADIVVLDEASSHLAEDDTVALELMFRRHERTLVTISHRLSVAERADQVIFFDGADSHVGTHQHLLADLPAYGELFRHARLFS